MESAPKYKYFFSPALIFLLLLSFQNVQADGFDKVLRTIKGVAMSALSVGLDEAGTRLLGPNLWSITKKIGEPVLKELYSKNSNLNDTEIKRVVYLIDNDISIRNNIRQRFNALPYDERNSLLIKIDKLEKHLFRIERLALENNLEIKDIKKMLRSVLHTPMSLAPSKVTVPPGIRRVDWPGSHLQIYYPSDLKPPKFHENMWIVTNLSGESNIGIFWNLIKENFSTDSEDGAYSAAIVYQIFGAFDNTAASKRNFFSKLDCDEDDLSVIISESDVKSKLTVIKCDGFIYKTYFAVRHFYSNGAEAAITAIIVGEKYWNKHEDDILNSLRLTNLSHACGFYDTNCCITKEESACGAGLSCQNKKCQPTSLIE